MQTAHVGALYAAFLAMMLTAGVPAVIAALSLGFMSNLFGSITHFGSGQAAVYYGAGRLRASVGMEGTGTWSGLGVEHGYQMADLRCL